MSEIRLKDVAFTKLPANAASFNALSCFLGRNGPLLNRLRLDIFSEDTKQHYTSSLRGSWVYNEELIQISRVFPRLSAILGRHLEEKKLLSLRELDVSTIPDFPVGRQDDLFHVRNRNNLVHLELAVKSARDEHPNRKGLQTLRIRAPSDILDRSIAFTSQWIDPTVDITFSFPAYTVHFPQKATNANESLAEVKETMLAILTSQHASRFLAILGLPGLESIETLTFGKCLPTIPQQTGPRLSPDFISLPRFQRTKLKTIRFVCNIPDTAAVLTIATCLKEIDNAPVTVLREIEFPADLVMFSPAMESLATRSGHCVTALRISDFRNADVLERVEEAGTPHHHIISGGRITGAAQKAEWFLKGLPRFLYMVIHDFPMVETVYMEQTKATRSISDRHAISGALMAIDHFENASKADASTLKTEISAWSENPLPFGQDPLRCQGTTFCSDAKQYG